MFQDDADTGTKIAVAWIAVFGSAVAALIAIANTAFVAWMNRRNQENLQRHQQELQATQADFAKQLEAFKAELAETGAEKDARRDYEYEAKKRLYQQCEPLMFELYMFSIGAKKRIHSLARTARQGNLEPGTTGWLSADRYYTLSTVYKLFAPLAVVKMLQRRLTLIDLNLDRRMREQFFIADSLFLTFTSDFKLAETDPQIPYDPNRRYSIGAEEFKLKLEKKPSKYFRQGLNVGDLDSAVEAMIVSDGKDSLRCVSFGEFESEYEKADSALRKRFAKVMELFVNFHPETRPVLWRILITQLFLYETIVLNSETDFCSDTKDWPEGVIALKEEKRHYWRSKVSDGDEIDGEVRVPFRVAVEYLKKNHQKRSIRAAGQG